MERQGRERPMQGKVTCTSPCIGSVAEMGLKDNGRSGDQAVTLQAGDEDRREWGFCSQRTTGWCFWTVGDSQVQKKGPKLAEAVWVSGFGAASRHGPREMASRSIGQACAASCISSLRSPSRCVPGWLIQAGKGGRCPCQSWLPASLSTGSVRLPSALWGAAEGTSTEGKAWSRSSRMAQLAPLVGGLPSYHPCLARSISLNPSQDRAKHPLQA